MITSQIKGGLGNQMFQYAAALSLAESRKTKIALDLSWFDGQDYDNTTVKRKYSLSNFNMDPSPLVFTTFPLGWINMYFAKKYHESGNGYDNRFSLLPSNTYLSGNFQSEKYFNNSADSIRHQFRWKRALPDDLKEVRFAKKHNSLALHIRRGDYITNKAAADILGTLEIDYYVRAYSLAIKLHKITEILVFSDDINWCKKNLKFLKKPMFISNNLSNAEEMQLMSLCHHKIIANSSFSWWAAWLGLLSDKTVIAPRRWFLDSTIHSADIVPESWETV